ncbi:sigma-70 family RNA polymerase sigma factor [Dictyobacter kobayashii]|uniref:Uncharacterized protein n=1 Tax=Dictyobacter kobayashii TaxID=2014872 RepID=A0A402AJI5_9CHLR|nr:sigma-70 family RNA polymerase sigma factor [Dictyobacter kobayashii]GCE19233.1 hypothetical protein KDK_30330 [Dictyobacter kobayashii]
MIIETLLEQVTAAQQGNLEAFSQIVERFRAMAYATAYTLLHDAQLAEDATQEAFIEAYLQLPKLHIPAAFPGWLRRIIFKQADRLTRKQQVTLVPLEVGAASDIALDELNPAQLIENIETQGVIQQAIQALPEHERMAILLFYGNSYSQHDVATFLEVPLSTVKKRLFDGRKHLKKYLVEKALDTVHESTQLSIERFPEKLRLLIALRTGDMAQVKAIIEHNPFLINGNLGAKTIKHEYIQRYAPGLPANWSALNEAIANHQTQLVIFLLDAGANINSKGYYGLSPLLEAVRSEQVELVEILLKRGAQIDAATSVGLTALHYAVISNNLSLTGLLLAHGASPDGNTHSPKSPLHWAALKGYSTITQVLVEHGADLYQRDDLHRRPLDWALAHGHQPIVELLLESMDTTLTRTDQSDDLKSTISLV